MIVKEFNKEIIESIKNGGVGVLPTDTLYGLVGSALSKDAVLRVYALKKRDIEKPLIILISNYEDLEKFDVPIGERTKKMLKRVWPGKVSVVLPCAGKKYEYLHRGGHTLAFRMPERADLNLFLREAGPIVAPSANPEGLKPAETIEEAKAYFDAEADFYVDGGALKGDPSAIIKIDNGVTTILRGDFSK